MFITLIAFSALNLAARQESPPAAAERSSAAAAEPLRERIHSMRHDLLVGGSMVRKAEDEATAFYRSRSQDLDRQTDDVAVELAERRAAYALALDRTLSALDPERQRAAASDASRLKTEITSLERELAALDARRNEFQAAIDTLERRRRERDRLSAAFEATGGAATQPLFVSGAIGLAPEIPAAQTDPLADDELLRDLVQRDPERARALIFGSDPARYWRIWPLTPPAIVLRAALSFPLPDLPGAR